MEEIMEEYGGVIIAYFTGIWMILLVMGLLQGDGWIGKVILWFGNHAC